MAEIGARSAEICGDWRQVGGSASRWRRSAGGAAAELLQYGREDTAERRDEERRPGAHSSHLRVESQRAKLLARERALRMWHVFPWPCHVACIPMAMRQREYNEVGPYTHTAGPRRRRQVNMVRRIARPEVRCTRSRESPRAVCPRTVAALYELFTSSRADGCAAGGGRPSP